MDPVERALVAAIRQHHNDAEGDRLRLILADWLEEHGDVRGGYAIRWHLLNKAAFLRRYYSRPRPRHDSTAH